MSRDAARGRLPTLPRLSRPAPRPARAISPSLSAASCSLFPAIQPRLAKGIIVSFQNIGEGGGPKSLFPFSTPLFSFLSFLKLDQLYRIPNSMHLGGLFFLVFKLISLSSTFSVKSNDRGLAGFRFKAGGKITVDP